MTETLDSEDVKLLTLARASRARNNAAEGAAVRDGMGRTYVATTVALPSLTLSALQVAVAMAVASGADDLEAAAVVGEEATPPGGGVPEPGAAAVADLGGAQTPIHLAGPDGRLRRTTPAGDA